jgi:hypothetical protein
MDGRIEQPRSFALRSLPIARVFFDIRNETRVEDRIAIVPGVESAIQVQVRALDLQIVSPAIRFTCSVPVAGVPYLLHSLVQRMCRANSLGKFPGMLGFQNPSRDENR